MYKGISREEIYPYVLLEERDLPAEEQTTWYIRPQTVRTQNVEMAGYIAGRQKTPESRAAHTTKVDRSSFLRFMAYIENFEYYEESTPRARIDDEADLIRAFNELDPKTAAELSDASRDPYTLREGTKKGSPSSSGHPSYEKTHGEGATTAGSAKIEKEKPPAGTA